MNYQQALAYAEECGQYGCVPGLENMQELLGRLGNPQEELAFVHIAGSNGKGSVMNFISTVLTEGCLLYTSSAIIIAMKNIVWRGITMTAF